MSTATALSLLDQARELRDSGDLRKALVVLQQAVDEAPSNPDVLYWCGIALVDMREYKGAIPFLEKILEYDPGHADVYHNLGIALEASGQWKRAQWALKNCLTFRPNEILARCYLGNSCYRLGDPEQGYRLHTEALAIEPAQPGEQAGRALTRLLRGDWEKGWAEYEQRWTLGTHQASNSRPKTGKLWTGQPLKGERILIHPEQGLGDTLMFLRCLPLVKALGGKVMLQVQPELARLCEGSPIVRSCVESVSRKDALTRPPKWYASLLSLPFLSNFGDGDLERLRYAFPEPYVRSVTKGPSLSHLKGLRVGFCPRGSTGHMNALDRNMPKGFAEPLRQIEGVSLVGFHNEYVGWGMQSWKMSDFADTAAIVDQLDVVVSCDTALAHLAASMGKPVWLMPPASPEFRWGLHETRTPWYETVKLYRRKHVGDWPGVIERIANDLQREAK